MTETPNKLATLLYAELSSDQLRRMVAKHAPETAAQLPAASDGWMLAIHTQAALAKLPRLVVAVMLLEALPKHAAEIGSALDAAYGVRR